MRIEASLTQERLAEYAGLDRTYVSSLERGKRNVSVINCARIAAALNVPLRELFPLDIKRPCTED